MIVRVKVAGVPDHTDPARWPFPTAGLVGYDPVDGHATFQVPDEDVPPQLVKHAGTRSRATPVGDVLTKADADQLGAWHQHLDDRYQEHAGKFRPELA